MSSKPTTRLVLLLFIYTPVSGRSSRRGLLTLTLEMVLISEGRILELA
jgi:hypothetical protein